MKWNCYSGSANPETISDDNKFLGIVEADDAESALVAALKCDDDRRDTSFVTERGGGSARGDL